MRSFIIILLLSAGLTSISCGQNTSDQMSNIVENKGIVTPLHKANVGKIVFQASTYSLAEYDPNDFVSSHEITDDSDLNLVAFFGNSLTNYLHQLDKTLTIDELLKRGNFQFSFYVDGELYYQENLNHRAGLPSEKNENTILYKPLISSTGFDSWGRFLWARFLYWGGAYSTLESGTHKVKIELRPYLNNGKLIVGDVIAEGEISLKYAEPKVSQEQMAIQPIQANSGWEVYEEHYDKDKIRALNERIAQNRFKDLKSIVVIKDGKLLLEQYFEGADRNTLHNTRSVGKSFASTMTGIAIKEGHFTGEDQTLDSFYNLREFDNYSRKKGKITLKSLLTMSSGLHGSDNNTETPGNDSNMYPSNDWVKFTLDLPMDDKKEIGDTFDYFTAGTVLLGDIIDISVPGGLEGYTNEKLFKPLGITKHQWQYSPTNKAHTAGGLALSALDFAKYGQLYKNGGIWNGQQILTSEWVEKTFTNYFPGEEQGYGFVFWTHEYSANGKSYKAFQASGYGGNKVIIFKDEPLVIVITATAFGEAYAHPQAEIMVEKYILPAVLDQKQ